MNSKQIHNLEHATIVFGSKEKAEEFMHKKHFLLNEQRPIDADPIKVEEILIAIEFGFPL